MTPAELERHARWASDLETERVAGVTHFKPGQIRAWRAKDDDGELALLRFADRLGHAWLVACEYVAEAGKWRAIATSRLTAGGIVYGWTRPPDAFRFTEGMLRALERAEEPPKAGLGL